MERMIVVRREVVKSGIGLGSALAVAISWSKSQSILWAIFHGILSWLYVRTEDSAAASPRRSSRSPGALAATV